MNNITDQLLAPVKFIRCACGVTFSQPANTRSRKNCDACRISKQKALERRSRIEKEVYVEVVRECGGPKILNIINNAGAVGKGVAHSREDAAKKFGVSVERIRQIEMKSLATLMLMGKMLIEEIE